MAHCCYYSFSSLLSALSFFISNKGKPLHIKEEEAEVEAVMVFKSQVKRRRLIWEFFKKNELIKRIERVRHISKSPNQFHSETPNQKLKNLLLCLLMPHLSMSTTVRRQRREPLPPPHIPPSSSIFFTLLLLLFFSSVVIEEGKMAPSLFLLLFFFFFPLRIFNSSLALGVRIIIYSI